MPILVVAWVTPPSTIECGERLLGRRCLLCRSRSARRGEVLYGLPTSVRRLAIDGEIAASLGLGLLGPLIGVGEGIVTAAGRQVARGRDDDPVAGKVDLQRGV